MPQIPTDGHGASLTFSGMVYNVISISGGGATRATIDITHLGTTVSKAYIPAKLVDPEDVTAEVEFDPQGALPVNGAAGSLVINWADATTSIWTWSNAFIKNITVGGAKSGERMTATITWQISGLPVVST